MSFSALARISNAISQSVSETLYPSPQSSPLEQKSPQQVLQSVTMPERSGPSSAVPSVPQSSAPPPPRTRSEMLTSFLQQVNRKLKRARQTSERAENGEGENGNCPEQDDNEPFSWQQTLIMGAVLSALIFTQVYVLQMTYNAAFPDMLQGSTTFSRMSLSRAFSLWLFVQVLFSSI